MELRKDFIGIIKDQTLRTLWSLNNVIDCIPESYWEKEYCEMHLWKHVYHTLHSLDKWYIKKRNGFSVTTDFSNGVHLCCLV